MDHLSEGFRAGLSSAMAEELKLHLQDMAEEAQQRERALESTLQKLLQDIKELEHIKRAEEEDRQSESMRLKEAAEAAKRDVQEQHREALIHLKSEAQTLSEQYQAEIEKRSALERELKKVSFLLQLKKEEYYSKMMARETERMMAETERWHRWAEEKEERTLRIALAAAVAKQRLLKELKIEAERWMVSSHGDHITTAGPAVFKTWSLREEWRKLQGNQTCLNGGLQSFILREDIEKILAKHLTIKGKIGAKFQRKIQKSVTEMEKRQEKVMVAEIKNLEKLEEKMRKELKKMQKAEVKAKKKQEAEDRKEAERLERHRAREERERARVRRPVFCFWPSGPQTTM